MAKTLSKVDLVKKIEQLRDKPILPNGRKVSRRNMAQYIASLPEKYYYSYKGKTLAYEVGGIDGLISKIQKHGAEYASNPGRTIIESEKITVKEEHALRRQLKESKSVITQMAQEIEEMEKLVDSLNFVKASRPLSPKWTMPQKGKRLSMAIPTAQLSDCHFDEVVIADQINGVNAYNREIGVARLKKFFENTLKISNNYINGVKMDGIVLNMTGDIVSGNIHEELSETNESPILPTCLFWAEQIIAGVELLGNRFDNIFIPCVTGNHGRQHRKPRAKNRAYQNYDWLIYKIIEKHFAKQKEITFQIPTGFDAKYKIYNTNYLSTHGDQYRGGNGVGGVIVPILRGDLKKRKRESATGSPYDVAIIAHFHTLINLNSLIINGSLKGYDEYAGSQNYDFEQPQQAFWLTDPKEGKTIFAPIHCYADFEHYKSMDVPQII